MAGSPTPTHDLSHPPGIEAQVVPDCKTVLVAFSGLRRPEGDHFDFRRATDSLHINRILIRDHHRSWYHEGVDGVPGGMDGLVGFLRALRDHLEAERVVVVGTSAGGYAAMLFGETMDADEVHAFAPQTFVGLKAFRRYGEPRWRRESRRMRDDHTLRLDYADLSDVLRRSGDDRRTQHHVYFDPTCNPDAVHISRIESVPRVRLHALPVGDHDVAAALTRCGDLTAIIKAATTAVGGRASLDVSEVEVRDLPNRVSIRFRSRRRAQIARNSVEVRLGLSPRRFF